MKKTRFQKNTCQILFPILFLAITGAIFNFEASAKISVLRERIIFSLLGIAVLIFLWLWDYRRLMSFSLGIIFVSFLLLILVLIPGLGLKIYGAQRWFDLKIFTFQPSELAKMAVIVFLAHWFANEEKDRLNAFLLLIGGFFILIMLEPDLGTALIILVVAGLMLFVARTTNWMAIFKIGIISLAALIFFIIISPYRLSRLKTYFSSEKQKFTASYHINQALIAIGSGGIWGSGIGNSKQKFSYLPEVTSDSIFALVAEETGFLGTLLIIGAYAYFFFCSQKLIVEVKDQFGKFLIFGCSTLITFQAFLNLSSIIGLVPFTGVPLPFLSSGGTALIIQFAAVGLILNVEKQNER